MGKPTKLIQLCIGITVLALGLTLMPTPCAGG
jgi:hypothetical protein